MKLQFLAEIAIEGLPPEQRLNSSPELAHASSLRSQYAFDSLSHTPEFVHFSAELFSSATGQRIKPRTPVQPRGAPLCGDPAFAEQTLQRGIERSFFDR